MTDVIEGWTKSVSIPDNYYTRFAYYKYRADERGAYTVYPYVPSSTRLRCKTGTRSGYRNHKIAALRKAGALIPPLHATCVFNELTVDVGRVYARRMSQKAFLGDACWDIVPTDPGVPTLPGASQTAYNNAYMKMLESYKDQVANVAAMLAESHETAQGLAKNVDNLESAFLEGVDGVKRLARNARKLKFKHFARIASDYWLEWSFGIKPILNDVHATAEALASMAQDRQRYRSFKGSGSTNSRVNTQSLVSLIPPAGFGGSVTGKQTSSLVTKTSYKIGGVVDDAVKPDYRFWVAGLTPDEILPAVWEIVPYSWVADYFTNIGDMISAYTTSKLYMISTWEVVIYEATNEVVVAPSGDPTYLTSWTKVWGKPQTVRSHNFSWQRGPALLSGPSFEFQAPSSLMKVINLAAFSVQQSGAASVSEIQAILDGRRHR